MSHQNREIAKMFREKMLESIKYFSNGYSREAKANPVNQASLGFYQDLLKYLEKMGKIVFA